jgi:Domain of unknown function (DUF4252)
MKSLSLFLLTLMVALAHAAEPNARLALPDFSALSKKASESVTITLDPTLLRLAGKVLDSSNPEDAAVQEIVQGLTGIYVRSYTFDEDNAYRMEDIEAITQQLAAPGWTRIVQTHSKKNRANVDIYLMLSGNKAVGLALVASEPREFTVVNILGSIDLDKLHKLQGHFGVPNLGADK